MACAKKERLVLEYQRATTNFSAAVSELQQKIGTSSQAEHKRLHRASDDARMKSERARLALEEHLALHSC